MAGRPSTITVEQREEFWRRYRAGESVLGIIGALRQRPGNINRVLEASGGIAPMPRRRCQRVLRFGEREEISRGLAAGDSLRVIARRLNRAVSTVRPSNLCARKHTSTSPHALSGVAPVRTFLIGLFELRCRPILIAGICRSHAPREVT